jgi:putative addiction module component (TIGR02574 family)
MAALDEIQRQALQLPPHDREKLAGSLLHSLENEPLNDVDKAWIAEADKRFDEIISGRSETIPGDQFFTQLRRKLGCN